jgi:hypothetical protein
MAEGVPGNALDDRLPQYRQFIATSVSIQDDS